MLHYFYTLLVVSCTCVFLSPLTCLYWYLCIFVYLYIRIYSCIYMFVMSLYIVCACSIICSSVCFVCSVLFSLLSEYACACCEYTSSCCGHYLLRRNYKYICIRSWSSFHMMHENVTVLSLLVCPFGRCPFFRSFSNK